MTTIRPVSKQDEPTVQELLNRIAVLEAQKNAGQFNGELHFKVSEKGAVSVIGMNRFPTTLYYEQWNRVLDAAPRLRKFMQDHIGELSMKAKS